jgi:hypothetical protein
MLGISIKELQTQIKQKEIVMNKKNIYLDV